MLERDQKVRVVFADESRQNDVLVVPEDQLLVMENPLQDAEVESPANIVRVEVRVYFADLVDYPGDFPFI